MFVNIYCISDSSGMRGKLRQAIRRKKRGLIDTASMHLLFLYLLNQVKYNQLIIEGVY